LLFFNAKTW